MKLEQKRDLLIKELERDYNILSENEIEKIILKINEIDAYIDECKYIDSL